MSFTMSVPSPLKGNQAALAANLAAAAAAIPSLRSHHHRHEQQQRNPSISLSAVAAVNVTVPTVSSPTLPPIALSPAAAPDQAATPPPVQETGGSSPQSFFPSIAPLKDEEWELLAMFFAEDDMGVFGEFGLGDVPNVGCQALSLGRIEDLQPFPRAPAPTPSVLPAIVTQAPAPLTATNPVIAEAPAPRALVSSPTISYALAPDPLIAYAQAPATIVSQVSAHQASTTQPVPSPLPPAPYVARAPMATSAVAPPASDLHHQQRQQQRRNHQPSGLTKQQYPRVQPPPSQHPPLAMPAVAQVPGSIFQKQSLIPKDPSKFLAAMVGSFPPPDSKKDMRGVDCMKRRHSVPPQKPGRLGKILRTASMSMVSGGVVVAGAGKGTVDVSWRPAKREGAATGVSLLFAFTRRRNSAF